MIPQALHRLSLLTMQYYYNINGQNFGPLTEEELLAEEAKGTINGTTPVIEPGGTQWKRWAQVRPETAATLPPAPKPVRRAPSVTPAQVMDKLLSLNQGFDRLLSKVFRLPSFVPTEPEAQQTMMGKWAGLTALAVWLGYIITGIALMIGSRDEDSGPIVLMLLGCILVGGMMQYFQFHFYNMTNALLFGNKMTLSGPALPRLLGAICLLTALVLLVVAIAAGTAASLFMGLAGVVISILMVYLYINADVFMVRYSPEETSPGRELNNLVRLMLRSSIVSLQVALPLCCILVAVSLCCNPPSAMTLAFNPAALIIPLVIFNLPAIFWLVLCLSSWFVDLYDSICSLSALSRKDK